MNRIALLGLAGACVLLSGSGMVLAGAGDSSEPDALAVNDSPATVMLPPQTESDSEPIKVASLTPTMPKFTVAAMPTGLTANRVQDFYLADDARLDRDVALAVQRYCAVMEDYPSSHQAEAAGKRLMFMTNLLSDAELDLMEASLPDWDTVSGNLLLTHLSSFYLQRAERVRNVDARKELEYRQKSAAPVLEILKGDVNDFSKAQVLKDFWTRAKFRGDEEEVRTQLLRVTNTATPSFTTWMIQTLLNKREPSLEGVTDVEFLDSVRKYYLSEGRNKSNMQRSMAYMEKAMELTWEMIENQPPNDPWIHLAHHYLKAAEVLEEREEALEKLEAHVANSRLSIMRWTIRFDLAINYTQPGRSSEDARKGFIHFKALVNEGTMDLIDPVINDVNIDEWTRGIIMCMLGHAYFGTNRTVEAQAHYDWVLDYYPGVSHPGETALYSALRVQERNVGLDRSGIATEYESFVTQNPSGAYSRQSLLRAAKIREKAEDTEGARATYERLINEYPGGSTIEVLKRMDELTRQE